MSKDMQEIKFEVKGSALLPYQIVFVQQSETQLRAYCSCPAGEKGMYCKHRFGILNGVSKGIVSGNDHEVKTVQQWLKGTDLEKALANVQHIEDEAKRISAALSASKKELARTMRGR